MFSSRRHSVVVPYKPPEFASSFGACVCCVRFRESERCGLTWPVVFGCNPPVSMLDVGHSNQSSNKGVAGSDEL